MLQHLTCRPGSYVEIIPVGLLCTLQYNNNGILQKVILGFDPVNHEDADVMNASLTIKLKENKIIPTRIPFSQGTTWVKGVFYTLKHFKSEGILPGCIQSDILADLPKNFEEYKFYACDLKNDSYNFVGGSTIAVRLVTFGFTATPGYQVYDNVDFLPIEQMMKEKKSPFVFPYISGIMIHEGCDPSYYVPAMLSQYCVTKVTEYLENHGYLRVSLRSENNVADVPFTDVVRFNITPKSMIVLNGNDQVLASRKTPGLFNDSVSRDKQCSICQHKMVVPHSGNAYCSDEHCPSRLYPYMCHFLQVLNLPKMEFLEFLSLIKSKDITCLIDVLSLEKYKDIQIECTLSTLLFASTPIEVCRSEEFFQKFSNCLGSIEALDFYLTNPDTIVTDLRLNKMYAKNYAEWLKDPHNLVQLRALLNMKDQIAIKSVSRKFEGAPIFRGKTICVTGKFQHGTIEDVIAILQSYSAKVVTKFDNTVNCVVLGHFEGEDTDITTLAMSYNVPIYSEDDFFKSYDIDVDIRKQRDILAGYLK